MDDIDYELKKDFWRAATGCLRNISAALPFVVSTLALAFLIRSALSEPFAFSCKSTPTKVPTRVVKPKVLPRLEFSEIAKDTESPPPVTVPTPKPGQE